MLRLSLPVLLALSLSACPAPSVDPGPDASTVDAGGSPMGDCLVAPAAPELPRLVDWTCPAGWTSVPAWSTDGGGAMPPPLRCEPPALPTTCPDGQRPVVGSAACAPVGRACPTGDFPDIAPDAGVRFVKPGATGDGSSPASPLGTIVAALAASRSGDTIVLSRGTFTEYVPLTRAVRLVGACATGTTITAPGRDATKGTLDIGVAATVEDLTITGPRVGAWILKNSEPATLRGVIVRQAEQVGVYVSDRGRAHLEDVLITDTLADPTSRKYGRGLQVRSQGTVTGKGVALEKNRDVAITLDGSGCAATLEDVVVRDTASEVASRAYGQGMEVRYGAEASLTRAILERNRNSAIVSDQPGTRVTLVDAVLQDTLATESNRRFGGGLEAKVGASISLTRTIIRRNRNVAVRLGGEDTHLDAQDSLLADTAPQDSDQWAGLGLALDTGATASLNRVVLDGHHTVGLLLADPVTQVQADDVVLRGTLPQAVDGRWGVGAVVMSGAALLGHRLLLEHQADSGLFLQTSAQANVDDLSIAHTGEAPPPAVGEGLVLQSHARATLHRVRLTANRRAAFYVGDGSSAQVTDLKVEDTLADAQNRFGRGLTSEGSSSVVLTRADFQGVRETALFAAEAGTVLIAEQVRVQDTRAAATQLEEGRALSVERGAWGAVTCLDSRRNREVAVFAVGQGTRLEVSKASVVDTLGVGGFGDGVVVRDGATAKLEDLEVRGSTTVGVAFSAAGGTLARGLITGNPVGLLAAEGSVVSEVAQVAPNVGSLEVQVDSATAFSGNTTRISGATVPLPPGLGSTPTPAPY